MTPEWAGIIKGVILGFAAIIIAGIFCDSWLKATMVKWGKKKEKEE